MAKDKPSSRVDAVREAVDQAFQSQIPRERISALLEELVSTAGRLRGAVDELRPATAEELKSLRGEVQALAARVQELESRPAPRRPTAAKPAPATRATPGSAKPATRGAPSAAKPATKRAAPKPGS